MTASARWASEPLHVTESTRRPSELALDDVLDALTHQWHLTLTHDGRAALVERYEMSLGRWLRGLERQRPTVALWTDPALQELPEFILGHCVAQMAQALASTTGPVNAEQVREAARDMMQAARTRRYCGRVVRNVLTTLELQQPRALAPIETPICNGA